MNRKSIDKSVERRLYAESMGKCMNPDCQAELFVNGSDIMERAHIVPYCETEDNSFENLIILCPNCHKKFDKTNLLDKKTVTSWKENRKKQLNTFFSIKYNSFEELKGVVCPLLIENKNIYENYYLGDKKVLWDRFEPQILSNNEKLKMIFQKNLNLFQTHPDREYSNLNEVQNFITHVNEFKSTRLYEEKCRAVLFPEKINSIFGIKPVNENLMSSTESLEELIKILLHNDKFEKIVLEIDEPYILLKDNKKIFLKDTPRLRQLYFDNGCFRKFGVRLQSLNFVLTYLKNRNIDFVYANLPLLREIVINNVEIVFVYEYCLSKAFLVSMSPKPRTVIVNLHNWNGEASISNEAIELSKTFNVTLLTVNEFYRYVYHIK